MVNRMNPIRILLVDDEVLLVDSLEVIFTLAEDMTVIGKAYDGIEALSLLESTTTDLALVDLNMNGMGGIELIKHIKITYPLIKVLVLTTFYDESNIIKAIQNGADGYLLKDSGRDAITHAIHQVMNGQSVLDQKVMQALSNIMLHSTQSKVTAAPLSQPNKEQIDSSLLSSLTKRELELCSMIAEGYTNSQISKFMFLSEGTVKNYMTSIYDKTGIHDRASLAIYLSKAL